MTREVTALPKAHLHLHFTGSMRVETVRDLARQHGIRLPDALVTGYPPKLARATDERGWFRFQRLYDAARACVRGEADMRRIVREAAEDDESGLIATDVGIDGAAASAEEAAMHIVDEDALSG